MDRNLRIVLGLSLVLVAFIGVVTFISIDKPTIYETTDLDKFESYDDLQNFLEENTLENRGGFGLLGGPELGVVNDATVRSAQGGSLAAESTGAKSADDYSQTNIQVEGVDEPDIVKNDGNYIYQVIQGNRVVIIDAFPASEMKIVSEIEFNNSLAGLFVKDNKLIVLESVYGYYYGYGGPEVASDAVIGPSEAVESKIIASSGSGEPETGITVPSPEYASPKVIAHVYDLGDIESPKLEDSFTSSGNYYTSRMINDVVYVVSSYYAYANNPVIPLFSSDSEVKQITASDIYYPVIGDSSFLFTSVMAVDVDALEFSGDVFLTGNNGVIYVSNDAMYLTNQKYFDYSTFQENMIREVLLPMFPSDIRNELETIINNDGEDYTRNQDLEQIFAKYFNGLSNDEKVSFQEELQESMTDFSLTWSKNNQLTAIHKIVLDGLDLSYAGSGEVPGYLLNQFSLGENDGYLRIATTTGDMWFGGARSAASANNLYVLDEDLKIVGKVEDIAIGERIYSARFVGDKAYMVTFRQVDPLYVIDVSDPENPEILGYLKVTGFSNYLQPYDENHLIGIGHEATLEGRAQGLKISLFDVSDFSNPLEVDSYVFEGTWSYSDAEYDHKAVLFDKERNLFAIPVNTNNYDYDSYWQGVYVFDINTEGIGLRGRIDHQQTSGTEVENRYYDYQGYVRRSLYLDDVLYTVSERKIKANDLATLNEIKSLTISVENQEYPFRIY